MVKSNNRTTAATGLSLFYLYLWSEANFRERFDAKIWIVRQWTFCTNHAFVQRIKLEKKLIEKIK